MKKKAKIISITFIGTIIVLITVFFVFVNIDKYHTDETALAAAVSVKSELSFCNCISSCCFSSISTFLYFSMFSSFWH